MEAEAAQGNSNRQARGDFPATKASGSSEQRRGRIGLLFKTTPVAVLRTGLELMLRDWGDLQEVRMWGGGQQCWVQGSRGGGDDV